MLHDSFPPGFTKNNVAIQNKLHTFPPQEELFQLSAELWPLDGLITKCLRQKSDILDPVGSEILTTAKCFAS